MSAEARFSPIRLFCLPFIFIGSKNTLQRRALATELCRGSRSDRLPQRGSTKIAQGKGAKRLPPWVPPSTKQPSPFPVLPPVWSQQNRKRGFTICAQSKATGFIS